MGIEDTLETVMHSKIAALAVVLAASLWSFVDRPIDAAPAAARGPMVVDAGHSSVMFRVKHMNVAFFYGRFNTIGGEVHLDEKNAAASNVMIDIDADSIDTNGDKRDMHLKGPDFFSVKEFPRITFKSKTCAKKGEDWEVVGEMTMRGVTKPLTVMVKPTGTADDPRSGPKAGFETEFAIKRSDFGMKYGVDKGGLADDVKIMISIEAAPKQ